MSLLDPLAPAIALLQRGDLSAAKAAAEAVVADGGQDNAHAHHLLGVLDCRMGNLDAGIGHLRRSVALLPDPGAMVMLMRAAMDAGRPREALEVRFQAEQLPAAAQEALWQTRAEAARQAGDATFEAGALERLLVLDPNNDPLRDRLIQLDLDIGHPAEAIALIDSGTAMRHRQVAKATALAALRRFDDAAAIHQALFAEQPDDRVIWRQLLQGAERRSDADQIDRLIAAATDAGYADDELAYARALQAKLAGDDEAALSLAQDSAGAGNERRRIALIATLADRVGKPDVAFAAASDLADATPDRPRWRDRAAAHRASLDSLTATTSREWVARWPAVPPSARPSPAFLVGFPRSGTTLLDTFLMGHPDIVVAEEEPLLESAARILGDPAGLDRVSAETVVAARDAYFAALDAAHPDRGTDAFVIDKLPLAMTGAAVVHRLFPDAKIIFAVRHPADAVLSNYLQAFRLNDAMANFLDLDDAAEFYASAMQLWTKSQDALDLDVHAVAYEALIDDPEPVLRSLIAWLGLDWAPSVLDHQATAASRGVIVTPSFDQVTQPLHSRAAGRWQAYRDRLDPILPRLDPWARHFGYRPILDEG